MWKRYGFNSDGILAAWIWNYFRWLLAVADIETSGSCANILACLVPAPIQNSVMSRTMGPQLLKF